MGFMHQGVLSLSFQTNVEFCGVWGRQFGALFNTAALIMSQNVPYHAPMAANRTKDGTRATRRVIVFLEVCGTSRRSGPHQRGMDRPVVRAQYYVPHRWTLAGAIRPSRNYVLMRKEMS